MYINVSTEFAGCPLTVGLSGEVAGKLRPEVLTAANSPFPFHHPPQCLVNLPLVSPPHPPEPGQHIGVQLQRDPLLWHPEPASKFQSPLPPFAPSVPAACGTPPFHASRSPNTGDDPASLNSFLPFHLPSIIIHIRKYKINCKAFHVEHFAQKQKPRSCERGFGSS
jgi:hypothetical protein